MSTTGRIGASAASVAVLVTGWVAGSHGAVAATVNGAAGSSTTTGTSATTTGSSATGTFPGSTETDRWGSLAVTVTLADGRISDVTYTSTAADGHSLGIESQAIPVLEQEVVAASSSQVQSISGATYTTTKYLTSLQSALDQAGV